MSDLGGIPDAWRLITASAIGATIGSFFSLCLNWMKANRDDARSQCDEFVELLSTAADVATAYRLDETETVDTRSQHCRLIGFQQRLSLARKELFPLFDPLYRELIDEDLRRFFDACTGGDAGQLTRSKDEIRAREAQASAASIANRVRMAHADSVKLSSYVMRKLGLK